MTEQEIFDKVWNFLNIQGKPSYDQDRGCMYRHPTGLACAVGCLLDDSTASIFDGLSDSTISNAFKVHSNIVPETLKSHLDFLERLQGIHDSMNSRSDWLTRWQSAMRKFASARDLTVPPIP